MSKIQQFFDLLTELEALVVILVIVLSVSASAPLIAVPTALEKNISMASLYDNLEGQPFRYSENITWMQYYPWYYDRYETLRMIVEGDSGLKYDQSYYDLSSLNVMNVTEAWRFMKWVEDDQTWRKEYKLHQYVCFNYSTDLVRNATKASFKNLYLVALCPFYGKGHCVCGFYVDNVGLVLLEPHWETGRIMNSEIFGNHNTTTLSINAPKDLKCNGWDEKGGYNISGSPGFQMRIVNGTFSQLAG